MSNFTLYYRVLRQSVLATALLTAAISTPFAQEIPKAYPSDYASVIAAAKKEGKVVIYGATDTNAANPLIKDFESMYPGIKVEYHDMNTTELYNRVISEKAAGANSGDVTWSSSMDLQIKLVNDGLAYAYKSPEVANLPTWSVWKNEAYGTTYEPVVFVYNKRLLKPEEVPQSHAEITKFFKDYADKYKNKVTSYDIEKSGVGFLLITQDSKTNASFWDIAKAFGDVGARYQSSTGTMMERIGSGENVFGYNILGSYALLRAKKDPGIAIVIPKDYTLVLSRIMFITKKAQNVNAAKLWLDYVLSKRGQTIISNQSGLGAVRNDVEGEMTVASLDKRLGNALKPIPVSAGLLTYLDQAKRLDFLKQWQGTAVSRK